MEIWFKRKKGTVNIVRLRPVDQVQNGGDDRLPFNSQSYYRAALRFFVQVDTICRFFYFVPTTSVQRIAPYTHAFAKKRKRTVPAQTDVYPRGHCTIIICVCVVRKESMARGYVNNGRRWERRWEDGRGKWEGAQQSSIAGYHYHGCYIRVHGYYCIESGAQSAVSLGHNRAPGMSLRVVA